MFKTMIGMKQPGSREFRNQIRRVLPDVYRLVDARPAAAL